MFPKPGLIALAALALGHTSSAHMTLKKPVPYGNPTTSPLNPDGVDFPCQHTGDASFYNATQRPEMATGVLQELLFSGTASHGGGTCQLAVTLDQAPTAESTFKIIQVYEGGCPTSMAGNDGSDPFTYVIPDGFPRGDATLAWVWYNRLGNREIYMNCAPIKVISDSDDKIYYDSLPNLYVLNLESTGCTSVEGSNQQIPFPGQFVAKQDTYPIQKAVDMSSSSMSTVATANCASAFTAQTAGVKGYKSAISSNGGGYGFNGSSASGGVGAMSPSAYGSLRTSGAAPAYASTPSTTMQGPAYTSPASSSAQGLSSTSSFPTMSPAYDTGTHGLATTVGSAASPVGTSTGSSASDGSIQCDSSAHAGEYGQYADGFGVVWRAVASGMSCSQYQQVGQSSVKRSALRHAHIRRHARHVAERPA